MFSLLFSHNFTFKINEWYVQYFLFISLEFVKKKTEQKMCFWVLLFILPLEFYYSFKWYFQYCDLFFLLFPYAFLFGKKKHELNLVCMPEYFMFCFKCVKKNNIAPTLGQK